MQKVHVYTDTSFTGTPFPTWMFMCMYHAVSLSKLRVIRGAIVPYAFWGANMCIYRDRVVGVWLCRHTV